jgi:hypothetical protein
LETRYDRREWHASGTAVEVTLRGGSVAEEELDQRLLKWLSTQGYPLEMRVARAFEAHKIWADHTRLYVDPDEKVLREIDVIAYIDSSKVRGGFGLHVVIECKLSNEKPWVLFTTVHPLLSPNGYVGSAIATPTVRRVLEKIACDPQIQGLPIFRRPMRVGYNMTQAFTSGKDVAYEAMTTAIKGAMASALAFEDSDFALLYLPAVIIDGRLFECFLNDEGAMQINEIKTGMLIRRVGNGRVAVAQVLSADHLDDFVIECIDSAKVIRGHFEGG